MSQQPGGRKRKNKNTLTSTRPKQTGTKKGKLLKNWVHSDGRTENGTLTKKVEREQRAGGSQHNKN